MACPAIPTCGNWRSPNRRRTLPGIIDGIEAELDGLGLAGEPISVRMTGCPNGCARPYQSDVGIVGRSGNKYVLYVGGSSLGDRLNVELKDLVPAEEIVPTLRQVLVAFRDGRRPKEGFGDYCHRVGITWAATAGRGGAAGAIGVVVPAACGLAVESLSRKRLAEPRAASFPARPPDPSTPVNCVEPKIAQQTAPAVPPCGAG